MSNTQQQSYLAGMQEVIGKTASFALTTLFFVIYAFAKNDNQSVKSINLDTLGVFAYLALFWFIYEVITFVMYLLFSMFLNERNKRQPQTQPPVQEIIEPKID